MITDCDCSNVLNDTYTVYYKLTHKLRLQYRRLLSTLIWFIGLQIGTCTEHCYYTIKMGCSTQILDRLQQKFLFTLDLKPH